MFRTNAIFVFRVRAIRATTPLLTKCCTNAIFVIRVRAILYYISFLVLGFIIKKCLMAWSSILYCCSTSATMTGNISHHCLLSKLSNADVKCRIIPSFCLRRRSTKRRISCCCCSLAATLLSRAAIAVDRRRRPLRTASLGEPRYEEPNWVLPITGTAPIRRCEPATVVSSSWRRLALQLLWRENDQKWVELWSCSSSRTSYDVFLALYVVP